MMGFCFKLFLLTITLAPVPTGPAPDPLARGYLGVMVDQGVMRISTVMPNTPAEKAGLRAGDDFVKVGDLKPQNFEEVRQHISAFRPGTELTIVVRRGEETKTVTVRLIALPPDVPGQQRNPIHFPPNN